MKNLFTSISLFALLSFGSVAADLPLTEGEALRLGLGRQGIADVARGRVGLAQADVTEAGLMPNPTLDYKHDRTSGSSTKREQAFHLQQSFDIAGRRGLRREAAELRVQAVQGEIEARHLELAAEIRRHFHEVLLRQNLIQATQAWSDRFARIESIVTKLARGGEVSGYDRRRLSRERVVAQVRLDTEHAELERAREQLWGLLGGGNGIAQHRILAGTLLPATPLPIDALRHRLKARPGLKALEERAAAADIEGRAAGRGWIPDVTLGIGPKRVDDGAIRETGVALSIAIPLPIFDRQQAGGQRAASQAMIARGEYALVLARAEGDLRGLWKQTERLRTAATEFRARSMATSAELTRIAEAAYRAGESTLLELLDAYKGALEAETLALDLEWKSRLARIELDQLTGVAQ